MPSLSTRRAAETQDGPDTGEEAAVAAAIRLHEWVQTNLRRLAAGRRTPADTVTSLCVEWERAASLPDGTIDRRHSEGGPR